MREGDKEQSYKNDLKKRELFMLFSLIYTQIHGVTIVRNLLYYIILLYIGLITVCVHTYIVVIYGLSGIYIY